MTRQHIIHEERTSDEQPDIASLPNQKLGRTTSGALCPGPPPTTSASEGAYTVADLDGLLHGQTDTTEAEIDAVLYQQPPEMDVDA